jgi:hypothetical protein
MTIVKPVTRKKQQSFRANLALSTALTTIAFAYGGRGAYAGARLPTGVGTYSCSGIGDNATDATQAIFTVGALTVTTTTRFGIDTSIRGGDALNIDSVSTLTFTDNYNSSITGALNSGNGTLSVTTTGNVTGLADVGILARDPIAGGDVTVSATDVSGAGNGIQSRNYGGGAHSVAATGQVTGTNLTGLYARNYGADLTISVTSVTGGADGIDANNVDDTGTLAVDVDGTVISNRAAGVGIRTSTGAGKQTNLTLNSGAGVSAATGNAVTNDAGNSTTLVNAGASVTGTISLTFRNVTGAVAGGSVTGMENMVVDTGSDITFSGMLSTGQLDATNTGSGSLQVTLTGTIDGTMGAGILADNSAGGTTMSLNLVTVIGQGRGIDAYNQGSGTLGVTATGTVTGNTDTGVFARNSVAGGDLTVSVADFTGGTRGVYARNFSGGALSITSTGTVTGTASLGIYAHNEGGRHNDRRPFSYCRNRRHPCPQFRHGDAVGHGGWHDQWRCRGHHYPDRHRQVE